MRKAFNNVHPMPHTHSHASPLQGPLHERGSWLAGFIPRREARIMPDENSQQQRANGLFLPYPLLAFILTLVLALGSGIAGLFIQVNSLQTTLLLRDNDYQTKTKELKDRIELLSLQIADLQTKEARRDEREKQKGRNN